MPNTRREIGSQNISFPGLLCFITLTVAAFALSTEYAAWRFGWGAWLGHSARGHWYQPWSILAWAWKVFGPLHGRYMPWAQSAISNALYGLLGGILAAFTLTALFETQSRRSSDVVDSGHFARSAEVKRAGLLDAKAGPMIGAFDLGKRCVPLRYDGELGVSYTESPGGGKTSGFVKPNFLIPLRHTEAGRWSEEQRRAHPWGEEPSIVALDIRGDLHAGTSGYQQNILGKHVLKLEPFGEGPGFASYNPLWAIRMGSRFEYEDCYAKMFSIVDHEGKGVETYWDRAALSFGAACIGKLGYKAFNAGKPEMFSLPGLADFVTKSGSIDALVQTLLREDDNPKKLFTWIENGKNTRVKPWILSAANAMLAKAPEEKSGVYGAFVEFLNLYRGDALRPHITRSTFTFREFADGEKASTLYICVPPMQLKVLRPYLRMVVEDALRELTDEGGLQRGRSVRPYKRSTILALDEIASLRYMDQLEDSSGFLRGYGVMLWLMWQSVAQQKKYYTENELLSETMGVLLFGSPKTQEGAEAISALLGEKTLELTKHSRSGNRFSFGKNHAQEQSEVQGRRVLTPFEVRGIGAEHLIGFVNGLSLRLRKMFYFDIPMLNERAKMEPIQESANLINQAPFLASLEEAKSSNALRESDIEPEDDEEDDEEEGPYIVETRIIRHGGAPPTRDLPIKTVIEPNGYTIRYRSFPKTAKRAKEGIYPMKKIDRSALKAMSPEELIEGFVTEAKLTDLAKTARIANRHVENTQAYVDEIKVRSGLRSLAPLLDLSDMYIAYSAAIELVEIEDLRKKSLNTLDRIADARSGGASIFANRARNMIRYGNPLGQKKAPTSET